MAPDPKTSLAATVLNDGKIVSYRSLSRELKVHCNVAKKMLYDFHQTQATKQPSSVHATYLLDGEPIISKRTRADGHQQAGTDVHMQSSPFMSSSMPQEEQEEDGVPQRSIILAREEDLQAAKAKLERLHSIHIYSLGPSSVQNLQILSESNREISVKYASEDPLVVGNHYGVIQNMSVRRRTGRRPLIAAPAPAAKSVSKPSSKPQETSKPDKKSSTLFDRPPSSGRASKSTPQTECEPEPKLERAKDVDRKAASKPANLKREQSDLFKSFSKPKAKLKREDTGSSAGESPAPATEPSQNTKSGQNDEPMKDASEDEQEDDFVDTTNINSSSARLQAYRQAQLRKMMDDDDEDMEDTLDEPPQVFHESEIIDAPTSQKDASPEPTAVVSGGRRRGRRKVMKKKTIKDDEGYLVTKEELAWESFSEDEPLLPKEKTPASTASSSAKGKKPGGKPGQGNIMSFFGKN